VVIARVAPDHRIDVGVTEGLTGIFTLDEAAAP
jgi:hypothetical protein